MRSSGWTGTVGGLESVKRRPQVIMGGELQPSLHVWAHNDHVEVKLNIHEDYNLSYEMHMTYRGKDLVVGRVFMAKKVTRPPLDGYSVDRTDVTSTWKENAEMRKHVEELRKVLRLNPLF